MTKDTKRRKHSDKFKAKVAFFHDHEGLAEVGQFSTPIIGFGGSILHAGSQLGQGQALAPPAPEQISTDVSCGIMHSKHYRFVQYLKSA